MRQTTFAEHLPGTPPQFRSEFGGVGNALAARDFCFGDVDHGPECFKTPMLVFFMRSYSTIHADPSKW
jgi:hypothetical protein